MIDTEIDWLKVFKDIGRNMGRKFRYIDGGEVFAIFLFLFVVFSITYGVGWGLIHIITSAPNPKDDLDVVHTQIAQQYERRIMIDGMKRNKALKLERDALAIDSGTIDMDTPKEPDFKKKTSRKLIKYTNVRRAIPNRRLSEVEQYMIRRFDEIDHKLEHIERMEKVRDLEIR